MTQLRNHSQLLTAMEEEYRSYAPLSGKLQQRALKVQVDGGSHGRRLNKPFPTRILQTKGAWIEDEDEHTILDFWQGHFANLLGHNPPQITEPLQDALGSGSGLLTGFTDELQIETAELLCQMTGGEKVRFTTSGTLGTMYSILLARAFTGRDLVMKISGGFHGAQPWGLKGVSYKANGTGFRHPEGEGIPAAVTDTVLVTPLNDPQLLEEQFKQYGDRISCLIMEPILGSGGFITTTPEFIRTARKLTNQYGALLILDEVISGFRLHAGSTAQLLDVQPDLAIYGKVMGGGMAIAAVAGRADILNISGKQGGNRVHFNGGTYSALPLALLSSKVMLQYLKSHESEIYPNLAKMGKRMSQVMEDAFHGVGILAQCTGHFNGGVGDSSLTAVHFPYEADLIIDRPDVAANPGLCDVAMRMDVLPLALLLEDVHIIASHGCWTTAHTEADMEYFKDAMQRAARRIRDSLAL